MFAKAVRGVTSGLSVDEVKMNFVMSVSIDVNLRYSNGDKIVRKSRKALIDLGVLIFIKFTTKYAEMLEPS